MGHSIAANDEILYLEARPQHISSLTTLIPRSFFSKMAMTKEWFPDTPIIRDWWRRVFEDLIGNPNCHVPISIDTKTDTVIGLMILDGIVQDEPSGGFLVRHPATSDHSGKWPGVVSRFAADEYAYVGERSRFIVEFMGVDDDYQGKGIGKRLLSNACEIADRKGWPMFFGTSYAKQFYLESGLGFEVVSTKKAAEDGVLILREPNGKTAVEGAADADEHGG